MVNPGRLEKSPEEEHLQDVCSDQENMNTTPSPPFQGGKNTRGDGVASENSKKVANPGAPSSSSTAAKSKKPKKKRQVDFCSGQQKCQICGRLFQSLKAVHGHMRVHKVGKKASRAFLRPAFTRPSGSFLEREYASVAAGDDTNPVDAVPASATFLLNSTQNVQSALGSASSSAFRHLVIDLNRSPPPEEKDGDDGTT